MQSDIPFDNFNKKGHTEDSKGNQLHQTIFNLCISAQSIDVIAQECKMPLSALQKELFDMQMNGMIEQDFSGMWKVI